MNRAQAAIAGRTLTEVLREPAFSIVVWATLALLSVAPWLALFSFGGEVRLFKDFTLSMVLVSGLVLSSVAAGSAVRGEIGRRTTLTLLAKPVTREGFLLAKLAGILLAVLLATCLFSAAIVVALGQGPLAGGHGSVDWVRLGAGPGAVGLALLAAAAWSYRSGAAFCSTAHVLSLAFVAVGLAVAAVVGTPSPPSGAALFSDPLLFKGLVLVFLAVAVLAAVAVSLSAWVGRAATASLTGALLVAGIVLPPVPVPGRLLLFFVPDFRVFWIGDVFYRDGARIGWGYLAEAALYAAGYIMLFWALGALAFRRRSL